jgi:uncharacterized protein YbaR (Trm112 family)
MISEDIIKILCCPQCRNELIYNENESTLNCEACGEAYPIQNNIPNLIIEKNLIDDR